VLGEEEVLVKPLGPLLARVPGYLGAATLGDGRVALILDPAAIDRIPDARARRTEDPAEPLAAGASQGTPVVLVVEDSVTVRALQRSILEAAGYRVETASDGAEAWDRLRRDDDISLVVTDIDMPRMDGFALVEAIRADAARGALPVIVVTARASDEDRRRGLEAGADAYLEKVRFDQRVLLQAVERLLGE
jgi:two-component system chemotaxis sensor kinase CheA